MALPNTPVAFVTGPTGFLGSHLVERLLQRGYEVRGLVHRDPEWTLDSDGWIETLPVTCFQGSLSDESVLRRAIQDVNIVYHLAGLTQAPSREVFYQTNVQGTLNVLRAIQEVAPDLHRVLITSSLAAVGNVESRPATEESPLRPVSTYGESKAAMERALRHQPTKDTPFWDSLPLTVVRPSSTYGPRDPDSVVFHRIVQRGICPTVQTPNGSRLSLVFVHDLIEGLISAAESETTTGETYMLGSHRTYSWTEIGDAIAEALGHRSPYAVQIPRSLLYILGGISEFWEWLSGNFPEFNREKAREICRACKTCRICKAQDDFGYNPSTPLAQGMRETVEWYRRAGWL